MLTPGDDILMATGVTLSIPSEPMLVCLICNFNLINLNRFKL